MSGDRVRAKVCAFLTICLVWSPVLLPNTALAEQVSCKQHNASGEGPSPASLSENSSSCSMSFGGSSSGKGNAILGSILQQAPQELRQLRFLDGGARSYLQQFNISINGPFDAAVVYFQALRIIDSIRSDTRSVDAFDALVYVIAGSVTEDKAVSYRRFIQNYWEIRSSLASSIDRPFDLMSRRELTERSYGSLRLAFGGGCFVAQIDNARFVASITDALRTELSNCGERR